MIALPPRVRTIVALCALTLFCSAGTAAAVDSPVILGEPGSNASDPSGLGSNSCTAYGYSIAVHNFTIPSSGILTSYQVRVGTDMSGDANEAVRLRTVHSNGSLTSAYVASEGSPNLVAAIIASGLAAFPARVSATAGDHLAIATKTDSAYLGRTQCLAYVSSEGGHSGRYDDAPTSPPVGANVTWTDYGNRTPNVRALLEPDADHDGYGDGSQDLCPNDPTIAVMACSGILFGTNTSLTPTDSNWACQGFNCLRVQTTIGGVSTAAPYRGVIVRWRATTNTAANMRIRVVKPVDSTHFQVTRSSDFAPIAVTPKASSGPSLPAAMTSVATRIPIDQGDYVGLDIPDGPAVAYSNSLPGSNYYDLANPADGGTVGIPASSGKEIFYNADIERDADGDGYGDATQDLCPTDPTRQTPCAIPSDTADTTAPKITKLSVSPKKFRVAPKGAVISKSAPKGTKFKFTLSEKATVEFAIYKVMKKKSKLVHLFTRPGKSGANSVKYSGRYMPKFKKLSLKPGAYKLTVKASDSSGNIGKAISTTFSLVR